MITLADKAVVACVHLAPTPGSPRYAGSVEKIYDQALRETEIFLRHGVDALIVENFRDTPFYPASVPPETTAIVAGVTREIVRMSPVPVGVAVLRNDASAALAIATGTSASFIRVNVHVGAVLSEQGVVSGNSHETLRLRRNLGSDVAIYADARVKHSRPFAYPDLSAEIKDLALRADGIIVSGELTGLRTRPDDLVTARRATDAPLLVGSGVCADSIDSVYDVADGFIVGSDFKFDGKAGNLVDEDRVARFMRRIGALRSGQPESEPAAMSDASESR